MNQSNKYIQTVNGPTVKQSKRSEWDMHLGPQDYKSGALTTRPRPGGGHSHNF